MDDGDSFRQMKLLDKVALASAFFVLLIAFPSDAQDTELIDLDGTNYFPIVHSELQAATQSVFVSMYQMRAYDDADLSSPTLVLVKDLVDAHDRGVRVEVFLDQSFRYSSRAKKRTIDPKNDTASEYLRFAGVPVSLMPSGRTLHQKLIVIDGRTVICGSHNWSDKALRFNFESSDLIRSKEYAESKGKNFDRLRAISPPLAARASKVSSVDIPMVFMEDKRLAAHMATESDDRAFDCYCLLIRDAQDAGTNVLSVSMGRLANDLGMNKVMDRTAYRRQLIKTLRKLQDTYHLISCEFDFSGPAKVTLIQAASATVLPVPRLFWSDGWFLKLSLSTKFAYFICLREQMMEPTPPSWSINQNDLAEKYFWTQKTLCWALRELENFDLLKITRSKLAASDTFADRAPNIYRVLPLRSRQEIADQWRRLEATFGKATIEEARSLAGLLNRTNSHREAQDLARLIDTYGLAATRQTVKAVASRSPSSAYRHAGCVLVILKRSAK